MCSVLMYSLYSCVYCNQIHCYYNTAILKTAVHKLRPVDNGHKDVHLEHNVITKVKVFYELS